MPPIGEHPAGNTEGPASTPADSPPPGLPNPARGITMEQAVARLRARRAGTLPPDGGEHAGEPPVQRPSGAESGTTVPDANTDVPDEDFDPDIDLRQPPPGAADHGPPSEEGDDDPVVFHMDDGTPVTRSEARSGYLRRQDYTRRRQEDSRARTELDQELVKTRQQRGEYFQRLEATRIALEANAPKPPDPALEGTAPYDFQAQRTAWLTHRELQRENAQEIERVRHEHAADMQREFNKRADWEAGRALEVIPSLKAAKNFEERGKVLERFKRTARAAGFEDGELAGLIDHRYFRILDWAAQGRAMELAKTRKGKGNGAAPDTERDGEEGPTITKATSQTRGSGGPSSTAKAVQEANERFRKTRRMEDAVALRVAKRNHAQAMNRKR